MANVKEVEWQGGIYSIADEVARGEAQQARSLANTAQASADTAQTSADNAKTAAGNAQTTANAAQTAAGTAQTTANAAQTTANAAQAAASRLETLVSGTPNPILKAKYFDVATRDYLNGMNLEPFVNANLDSGYDFLSFYEVASQGFVIDSPVYTSLSLSKVGSPFTVQNLPAGGNYSLRFYFLEIKRF